MNAPHVIQQPNRSATVVAVDRRDWSEEVSADFDRFPANTSVGTRLLVTGPRHKVWALALRPGDRFPAHEHRHSYSWTALTAGTALQHHSNGETRAVSYEPGDHTYTPIDAEATFRHDLINTGDATLEFITIEYLAQVPAEFEAPEVVVPATHADLLEAAHFGHLATVRPDGSPQGSVMWFAWDGSRLRFTHTRTRQKLRNLEHEPRVSLHVQDLAAPYRTLEVRGIVESIDADDNGSFYRSLQIRYGRQHPIYDAADRVVITVRPTRYIAIEGGLTRDEQQHLHRLLSTLEAPTTYD